MQFYIKQISPNSVQIKDCLKLWKSLACLLFRQKSFLEQTFIESYCHLVARDFILYFIMYNMSHVCWWSHGKEPVLTWHPFRKHSCRQWQVLTHSHLQGSPQCRVILSSTLIGGKAEWLKLFTATNLLNVLMGHKPRCLVPAFMILPGDDSHTRAWPSVSWLCLDFLGVDTWWWKLIHLWDRIQDLI